MKGPRRSSRRSSSPGHSLDLFLDPEYALANEASAAAHPDALHPALPAAEAAEMTAAPGESPGTAIPVAMLTETARDVLQGAFPRLWIRGEVTDFKRHRNGHWYFCLRDEDAQIRCVVWARDQRGIPASPDPGMLVTALGQLTVYPARGEMQLTVTAMEAEGDGLARKALALTVQRLQAEGLLAPERKRVLPRRPRCIAVVTSPDGAAIRDIVAVARRRSPGVSIVVIAAAVQGERAPDELCAALSRLARWGGADVAIVGRGGGGKEDLRAFDDERVARAVAALPMPVISAVGHEIDMCVCDLVADVRAATPSAAAEAAVPLHDDLVAEVGALRSALGALVLRHLDSVHSRVDGLRREVSAGLTRIVDRRRAQVETLGGRLNALSPLATLARGYAVARGDDGTPRTRASAFVPGDAFELVLRDGRVHARTERVDAES